MSKQVVRKERNKMIAFYVSEEEKQAIAEGAYKNDISVSDYCRKILLSTDVRFGVLGEIGDR